MGEDRPDDITDGGRAKRPPPTLELSATELPRDETVTVDESVADPDAAASSAPDAPRRSGGIVAAMLSGAIAGAVVAGLAWFAASTWLTSTPEAQPAAPPQVNAAGFDDLSARIAKLEARPAPVLAPAAAPAQPPDLSGITSRLDALDKSAAEMRDETTSLRAQSTQALSAATDAQKDVKAQPVPVAPDLSSITGRLSQIETTMRGQNDKIAEQARKPVDELATRRIATASLLDAQVRAGEPFAAALTAAKTLAPDAKFAPLDGFAAAGVPSAAALARALLELPQLVPPASSGTSAGLIDRLTSGATRLVKIERTDSPNADNAIFARAADAARRDDVTTAARELGTLPPAERAAVQPWLDRVTAREAARAASRQFANDALAAMSKP